jgi:hypothetical protein
MLTHHRRPVCLSLVSTDLPLWSVIETAATLYQKDQERFHLLLTEPPIQDWEPNTADPAEQAGKSTPPPRLLWLEISPYRVIMTMQGNGKLSYRHFWEQGLYSISRYWLQSEQSTQSGQLHLRNFTRSLILKGKPLPEYLRVEYELWSEKVQLGRYVLSVEIEQ